MPQDFGGMADIGGLDFETLRLMTLVGMLLAAWLFLFKLAQLARLMDRPGSEMEGALRAAWAVVILFVPLSIGAGLYARSERGRVPPAFAVPLAG